MYVCMLAYQMLRMHNVFTGPSMSGTIEELFSFNTQIGFLVGALVMCFIALVTTIISIFIGYLLFQRRAQAKPGQCCSTNLK